MLKKILLGIAALLVIFLIYVSLKDNKFYYERSGIVKSTPEKIYPFISILKLNRHWSPYEKLDPHMKKTYAGPDGKVGSSLDFIGNSKAGSGKLEILKLVPNQSVQLRLTMTKPLEGVSIIDYKLTPDRDGVKFTWSMSGENNFLGKLMTSVINCDKIIGGQFEEGIKNLKMQVEEQP